MMMSGSGAETANLVGSAFIIISAITNALYNVLARKLTQRYSLLTITSICQLSDYKLMD
ncbi:drug/metabolite transporter (DMT)-like permease [Priestia aryabhattai]